VADSDSLGAWRGLHPVDIVAKSAAGGADDTSGSTVATIRLLPLVRVSAAQTMLAEEKSVFSA